MALIITIQTFSDTVCPWSYIGQKNLDKAIDTYKDQHPEVEFEVTWNPFYLHPEAKISGKAPESACPAPSPPPLPSPRRLEDNTMTLPFPLSLLSKG